MKQSTENNETETIQAIVAREVQAVAFDVPEAATADLAPVDYRAAHQMKITALRTEAGALPAIVDKETAQANQSMLSRLVKIRSSLDASRLAITEPLRKLKADVDEYFGVGAKGGLQAQIKAIEEPLVKRKEVWEDEQERIRQEAIRIRDERNRSRAKHLVANGLQFDGVVYHLESLIIHQSDVFAMEDHQWEQWCTDTLAPQVERWKAAQARLEARTKRLMGLGMERVRRATGEQVWRLVGLEGVAEVTEKDVSTVTDEAFDAQMNTLTIIWERRKEEARLEKERQKADEDARMKRLLEEQQAAQKKLDDDRAALDAEKTRMRKELINNRVSILKSMGAAESCKDDRVSIQLGRKYASFEMLGTFNEQQWSDLVSVFEDEKAYVKEKIEQQATMDARSNVLIEMGVAYDGDSTWTHGNEVVTDHLLATMDEEQWEKVLSAFKQERERTDEVLSEPPIQEVAEASHNWTTSDAIHALELACDEVSSAMDIAKDAFANNESGLYHINLAARFFESMKNEVKNAKPRFAAVNN